MKSLKKLFTAFTATAMAMAISAGCAFAAADDADVVADRGRIDWATYTIIAEGTAAGKETAPNPVIKQKQAAVAAKVVAERNLVEVVNGVMVRSGVTVKDSILSGDVVEAQVQGVLKGAKEIDRRYDPYGNCTVTMALPMFGNNSLAKVVMPRTVTKQPFPQLHPNVKPAEPTNKLTVNVTVTTVNNMPNMPNIAQPGTTTTTVTTTTITTSNAEVKAAEPSGRPSHPTSSRSASRVTQQPTRPAPTYAEPTYAEPTYSEPTYSEPTYTEPNEQQPVDYDPYAPYDDEGVEEVVPYEQPVAEPEVIEPAEENTYYDVTQAKPVGNFSSLVVDCRGLEKELKPVMSAVIRNTEGQGIYGVENLDYDLVTEKGMAAYTKDPTLENVSRVGENPLVVRAVKLDDQFGSTPYISVADANRVLLENQATGFLDNLNVVFIR